MKETQKYVGFSISLILVFCHHFRCREEGKFIKVGPGKLQIFQGTLPAYHEIRSTNRKNTPKSDVEFRILLDHQNFNSNRSKLAR